MKYLLPFMLFSFVLIYSCKSEPDSGDQSSSVDTTQESQDSTIVKTDSAKTEDSLPLIDNISVLLNEGKYAVSDNLNGKDVNYYNLDVEKGVEFSVKLEGTNKFTNLIIFSPVGKTLFMKTGQGEPIEWTGSFESSGRATFHVSLKSGHAAPQESTSIHFTVMKK